MELGDRPNHWWHVTIERLYGKAYGHTNEAPRQLDLCSNCATQVDKLLRTPPAEADS